jgi:enterochelin esterase-like enzyme
MIRFSFFLLGVWMATTQAISQPTAPWQDHAPTVAEGRIERMEGFQSRHVDSRPIDVWLPADYTPNKRYAVLYMQDGQMLFDATQSWNKQAWNVHLALAKLMREGKVHDTIVVGIPNNGKYRYSEYYPEKYLALLPADERDNYIRRAQWGKTMADAYLRFVVEELKPAIDKKYATRTEPEGTFIMGSSMGGMISLYALCEYPEVFGGVAALSTHWIGKPGAWGPPEKLQNASMPLVAFQYLRTHLPVPGQRKLYFDHGTEGLDATYGVHQTFVDALLRESGYEPQHWMSLVFKGTGHSEADWSARLAIPLTYLLGRP